MALRMTTCSFVDTTIVECSGRIVLGDESANFRHLVKTRLTECKQIVVDLGGVTYIDSIGLGVLVGLLTSAQKAGGDIKLANLKPGLIDVLDAAPAGVQRRDGPLDDRTDLVRRQRPINLTASDQRHDGSSFGAPTRIPLLFLPRVRISGG